MKPAARSRWTMALAVGMACAAQAAPPTKASAASNPGAAAAQPAAAGTCVACHGGAGEGQAQAGFPRLAGLGEAYLLRQLTAFADGSRRSPVMMPIAAALPVADRAALAMYFSSLPVPAKAQRNAAAASAAPAASAAAAAATASAKLATRGRWSDGLPACEQCHGPGGRGVGADFPALTGQTADYLANQLAAWKSGARPPGPLGLMAVVAKKLSDADIRGVAEHFAALPATGATATATAEAKP